jgi:uridylate kinase
LKNHWRQISISLGATINKKDGSIDIEALKSIVAQCSLLVEKRFRMAAVVGAGGLGRAYLSSLRRFTQRREDIDSLGINCSRVNALLLIDALRAFGVPTNLKPFESVGDVAKALNSDRYPLAVSGGLGSGLTSDSSAAKIAATVQCPLVIVSTQGGILDNDQLNTGERRILESVNRSFLRGLLARHRREGPVPHVLDEETIKILLKIVERERSGFFVAVTGYENISKVVEDSMQVRRRNARSDLYTRVLLE